MTPEILTWLKEARFSNLGSVLEVGSMNINGSGKDVLPHKSWLGVDMRPGEGVDLVCKAENLPERFGPIFDAVVCLETLEHCEDWRMALRGMWHCLRPRGLCFISTPGHDFPRHGYPDDYWRFSIEIWRAVFAAQMVVTDQDFFYPHNGHIIVVAKIDEVLDLSIEPLPVPELKR